MSVVRQLHVDAERVVHDVLDGEVLAIRNDTGTYYSLVGTAADVWVGIVDGLDETGIVARLAARYDADEATIAAAVAAFVDRLLDESLVLVGAGAAGSTPPAPVPGTEREAFTQPELQVYTDMQDLLLFDPIHEVGPAGWPSVVDSTGD